MSQVLGKGLSALLEDSASDLNPDNTSAQQQPSGGSTANTLPIGSLQRGKYQPRSTFDDNAIDELAQSIKEQGILQPIIVRPINNHTYEILAGERRFRAAQKIGLPDVPVIIRADITDTQALEIALIENIQRQNLTPIEEAEGYKRLQQEFDYTQEQLADILGKSRSHVTNLLRLLTLADPIKAYINEGKLSMGHARALVSAENPEQLAEEIVSNNLSVREVEKRLKEKKTGHANTAKALYKAPQAATKKASYTPSTTAGEKDEDLVELERALSSTLGLKVAIDETEAGGTVTLHFTSLAELDIILQKLGDE